MNDIRVIYPMNGGIAILTSSGVMPLDETTRKDVPFGVPYRFVHKDVLFALDNTFREAFTADFSKPDGFGLGAPRWFIERAERELTQGINVETNTALIKQMKDEVFITEGVRL